MSILMHLNYIRNCTKEEETCFAFDRDETGVAIGIHIVHGRGLAVGVQDQTDLSQLKPLFHRALLRRRHRRGGRRPRRL